MTIDAALAFDLERVLDRLDAPHAAPPTLAELARLAGCSPWHFHRQFRALAGVPVQEYARGQRLARAARQLAFRTATVGDIAGEAGYANAESFSRAFRREAGQSPSEFRAAPDLARFDAPARAAARTHTAAVRRHESVRGSADRAEAMRGDAVRGDKDVRIETVPARRIALLVHRGDPARLGERLRAFIGWRRAHALPPSRSATFNLLYDDPASVAAADWRFGLACECDSDIAPNAEGIEAAKLAGGRHAVLPVRGGDAALEAAIEHLYGEWLPRSGELASDAPLFLRRLTFYPDVPEREALSELWLPLCGSPPSGATPRPTA